MPLRRNEKRDRSQLGERIDAARKRKGMTLSAVAQAAGYDQRTVRNVIKGRSTRPATLKEICEVVGINHEADGDTPTKVAKREHGAYVLSHFDNLIGQFYAIRRSFSYENAIVQSIFRIQWNEQRQCLTFEENQKYHSSHLDQIVDHSQSGDVYFSNTIGLVHLLTNVDGALRLITVARLDPDCMSMGGAVLTQAREPIYYRPSVSPIRFFKIADSLDCQPRAILPNHAEYDDLNKKLVETERMLTSFSFTKVDTTS
jgi:transcriptional regulator with XRE-family HTH domain